MPEALTHTAMPWLPVDRARRTQFFRFQPQVPLHSTLSHCVCMCLCVCMRLCVCMCVLDIPRYGCHEVIRTHIKDTLRLRALRLFSALWWLRQPTLADRADHAAAGAGDTGAHILCVHRAD